MPTSTAANHPHSTMSHITNTTETVRAQRLAEMRAKAAAARFGELYEISKADWVREVTDASKSVTVVAHLYEDGIVECRVMEVCVYSKIFIVFLPEVVECFCYRLDASRVTVCFCSLQSTSCVWFL